MYIIPEILFSFPVKLIDYLIEKEINFIIWVPSVLINVANTKVLKNKNVLLKTILFIGEVMPNKQLNYWREHIKDATFSNVYGPTETTVICSYYNVTRKFKDDEPLPIGIACKNVSLLILDENGNKPSHGEIGELHIRGSYLGLGYWNDPQKTSLSFIQNPLNSKFTELLYKSGDLVKVNDYGELMFLGRKDSQIKHMGYRIELGEIENAVTSIDNIEQNCVLYDSENGKLVLFYVAAKKRTVESDIHKNLFKILPKYMIPNVYVALDNLPKNANGKIDRLELKKRL
jgi:non-ribosomal peptide synthetase component F